MGSNRNVNKEQQAKKISVEYPVDKKQLFELWVWYNRLVKQIGRKEAISEIIMGITMINLDALKYFLIIGFETINKEYFKEFEDG